MVEKAKRMACMEVLAAILRLLPKLLQQGGACPLVFKWLLAYLYITACFLAAPQ